jgi:hypothetical protein
MDWNDLLNQLEGQTKQKLLALDRVGVRCSAVAAGQPSIEVCFVSSFLLGSISRCVLC